MISEEVIIELISNGEWRTAREAIQSNEIEAEVLQKIEVLAAAMKNPIGKPSDEG